MPRISLAERSIVGPVCHDHGITGYGNPDYGVMIVGIAPGKDEWQRSRRPFTGPSGKLLDAILKSRGWPRDRVYTTNLICWWKNDPDEEDILSCRERLLAEIGLCKPKLIIPMGTIPSLAFTGSKITEARGKPKWNSQIGCYVMPTFHPSAILRAGQQYIHDVVRDISKIPTILGWPDEIANSHVEYEVVNDTRQAQSILDGIPKGGTFISLDIETNFGQEDIDIFTEDLLCLSITYEREDTEYTYAFPRAVLDNLQWPIDGVRWGGQNFLFDTQGLRRWLGIRLPITVDTLLKSYACDERPGIHALELNSQEFLGSEAYKLPVRKEKRKTGTVEQDSLLRMNAHDTAYTYRWNKILDTRLDQEDTRNLYENILLPCANVFADAQYRGIAIDKDAMRELALEWIPAAIVAETQLQDQIREVQGEEIVLNSTYQLSNLLFRVLSLPVQRYTPTGHPSTDKESIEALAGMHPIVDGILEVRQLNHMIKSYLEGVRDDIKLDGRIHPKPLLHNTVTGRTAYHDPPVQTIPHDVKPGSKVQINRVRKIFAANVDSDKYVLAEFDYKQIELWMGYYHSGDSMMLEGLQSGDFHGATARDVFGVEPCKAHAASLVGCTDCAAWDYYRTNAKRVGFGIMYGRTEYGLSKGQSRIADSPSQARPYLKAWKDRYPTYMKWYAETMETAIKQGELVSASGRKRRFRWMSKEDVDRVLRQAVNFPIQSTASDYTLTSLIRIAPKIESYNSYPLLVVHDSILFQIDVDHFDEVTQLIRYEMELPRFGLPGVKVDAKYGPNWYDMQKLRFD